MNQGCPPSVPYMQTSPKKSPWGGFKRVWELSWSSDVSSLNLWLRQLLMQPTTPATTCLTTEGSAKCATTWHWLMTVSSFVLSAVCKFHSNPTASFYKTGLTLYVLIFKWTVEIIVRFKQYLECNYKLKQQGSSGVTEKEETESGLHSFHYINQISYLVSSFRGPESLRSFISNTLQKIGPNQRDQIHWMPFVQNQRT